MPRLRAIIFDLDDTLYAERDYVLSGFQAVAVWASATLNCDLVATHRELAALFEAGVRRDTFDRWLNARGLDAASHRDAMVAAYRDHEPTIDPLEGVVDFLQRLRVRFPLGLVTDGWSAVQRRKIKALRLAQLFDVIVYSDDLGREHWKPSTRPFEEALCSLRVAPVEAVYVGDNCTKDFFGARAIGMRTLRFRHTRGEYRDIDPETDLHAPDETVTSIDAVEEVITRWTAETR